MTPHQIPSSAGAERAPAGFHPTVWGDYFLKYASCPKMGSDDGVVEQIRELKDQVKRMLVAAASDGKPMVELLNLIDHIQHLGIGYQFEKEIDDALKRIYERSYEYVGGASCTNDLHTTALMFRLLRQQGHRIPCNVFSKFKGPEGKFDESLKTDARGLLSLYEASHLRVHGEEILDEALAFTLTHLNSIKEKQSPPLRDEISRALKHCIRKNLKRIEAWHFIRIYEQDASHSEVLLKLATLDFSVLQKLHQKELSELTRWWKSLDFEKNFPFARDRMVELYLWGLGGYEPEHALPRIISTKVKVLLSLLDDIYDVYGKFEEMELFTHAIERWDMEVIDELPEYMQLYYKALLNLYSDIEQMLPKEVRSYRIYYGIEAMKIQVRAYFDGAKWYHEGSIPTMEEYMSVTVILGALFLLVATSFMGMGDVATKDAFEWLFSDPKIVRASGIIYRLMDDIVTHKFEQKRGHVASAVECYMRQHGVTEEEAKQELRKQVDDTWKDMNEELLRPTAVPFPLVNEILNVVHLMDLVYKEDDIYTHSDTEMKAIITFLLVNPLPI